jgi:hypothetical protein
MRMFLKRGFLGGPRRNEVTGGLRKVNLNELQKFVLFVKYK